MANSTSHFLSSGSVSSATRIINKWPYKPEKLPNQRKRDQIKERNLTLKQTADQLLHWESMEFEAGLLKKKPKKLTGEYVRQIETKAISKCRRYCKLHNLDLGDMLPKL